jgi:hypothetical protein
MIKPKKRVWHTPEEAARILQERIATNRRLMEEQSKVKVHAVVFRQKEGGEKWEPTKDVPQFIKNMIQTLLDEKAFLYKGYWYTAIRTVDIESIYEIERRGIEISGVDQDPAPSGGQVRDIEEVERERLGSCGNCED